MAPSPSIPPGKLPSEEPVFQHPPLWIHVSEAGKWLLSKREAKRRAVLKILDRLPTAVRSKK